MGWDASVLGQVDCNDLDNLVVAECVRDLNGFGFDCVHKPRKVYICSSDPLCEGFPLCFSGLLVQLPFLWLCRIGKEIEARVRFVIVHVLLGKLRVDIVNENVARPMGFFRELDFDRYSAEFLLSRMHSQIGTVHRNRNTQMLNARYFVKVLCPPNVLACR